MTFNSFKRAYRQVCFVVFAGLFPFVAQGASKEMIIEKHMEVAMRMIGHEVLKCLGDDESRILPIERTDEAYRIPFELEFGFDPIDIVDIVDNVMAEAGIATDYLVQVEQCGTKEIVHSFVVRKPANPDLIPCGGRVLPKDCYSLLVTILPPFDTFINPLPDIFNDSSFSPAETQESSLSLSSFVIIPLFFLIGLIAYFMRDKNNTGIDPNLILVGASQFDKKNMALTFKDNRIELSHKEAELLSLLHTSANAPLTREVLLQRVWGDEGDYVGRTLDVFISKLRKKLEADTSVKIVNIRGVGYKLVMNEVPKHSFAKGMFSF